MGIAAGCKLKPTPQEALAVVCSYGGVGEASGAWCGRERESGETNSPPSWSLDIQHCTPVARKFPRASFFF